MKSTILSILFLGAILLGSTAHADLCKSVTELVRPVTPGIENDEKLYEELFSDATYQGDRRWNGIILQCNRQRDTKGDEVLKITGSAAGNGETEVLKAADLDPKVIRGHYDFVGLPIGSLLGFKYVYMLSKEDGVWTMIIPYKPLFNELVEGRVDFDPSHAEQLYDASQVSDPSDNVQVFALNSDAKPISSTLCSTSTYFPGDAGKYDDKQLHRRDPENKFISHGLIEYRYEKDGDTFTGCRVKKNIDLYWRWDGGRNQAVKVTPQGWILDNFVRTSEAYWSIPGIFRLKLLLEGHNDASFPQSTRNLFQKGDHLTVRFATKFLRAHFNQMYKSNVFQPNNFSTMTIDGSYWHEVGHAFGLDDEYGFVEDEGKKSCKNTRFTGLYDTLSYQMCDGGATEKRTIYQYIAVSRYLTKQQECNHDNDCGAGRFCNAGLDLKKNQCMAKKADDETCDIAGGDHQCKSGYCKLSRCYTPNSVPMGETCYLNDACKEGKCSSLDGTKGTCVCQADADCGLGKYCNAGLDITKNSCVVLKENNETCDIAGGGHQCKSGFCKFSRCYTPNSVDMSDTCYNDDACKEGKCSAVDGAKGTCVCKEDSDCGAGKWCDAGFDTKVNACRPKLDKGEKCGSVGTFGNDHKCKSGNCSGAPNYKCK
ncbi:MAG: hypothetical protein KF722_16720 [Nitrospira sp.]|nr:hypothetical protein [Nitrospira sp.]